MGPCQPSSKSNQASCSFQSQDADLLYLVSHLSPEWQESFDQNPGIDFLVFMGPYGSLIRKYEDKKGALMKCKPWSILRIYRLN